eukprot:3554081-Pleurochrysis_carterae.AAC.3
MLRRRAPRRRGALRCATLHLAHPRVLSSSFVLCPGPAPAPCPTATEIDEGSSAEEGARRHISWGTAANAVDDRASCSTIAVSVAAGVGSGGSVCTWAEHLSTDCTPVAATVRRKAF